LPPAAIGPGRGKFKRRCKKATNIRLARRCFGTIYGDGFARVDPKVWNYSVRYIQSLD
jgi:hypothetical protein